MNDLLLRGHTCSQCRKIKLCEPREEIFIDTELDSKYPRDSPSHMSFNGLRLDDLEAGSQNGCSLGKYLSSQLREGYPETWTSHDLKLYTDDSLGDRKLEFSTKNQYVHAPAHKGKTYVEFLSYEITTDEVDWRTKPLTRKPIVADPLSDITAATIRDWKLRCDTSQSKAHTICSRPSPGFFPTRLIEIIPHVRLVDGKSLNGDTEYTALSYCWGGDLKTCLRESNKDSYRTEIPWDKIPRTIQDAILTSQKLGIGFIWVDSLCIIQDSKADDKNIEIGQMTQVYTHAAFTIAARRAPDAHRGFLHKRPLPSGTTTVDFCSEDGKTRQCTLTFKSAAKEEDQNVLDTQGWTLQEYLMSRRLLIIGSWTTTWSCRKERVGNCDGWTLDREKGDPFNYNGSWTSSENKVFKGTHRLDAIAFFGTHPDSNYPKPEDHLILWEWNSPMRGGAYVAGLWVKDFPDTLLWENRSRALYPRPSDQGPSWSWTAINSTVTWGAGHGKDVLSVDSIECDLDQPSAPFGSVKRGALRVTGPALDLEWKRTKSTSSLMTPGGHHLRYLMPDGMYINARIKFLPDAEEPDSDWTTVTLLAVKVDDYTTGIVLRKSTDSEHSRFGYFDANLPGDKYHIDCQLPLVRKWGSRTFTII
ncbi:Heterokaryon incompatibility [Fusarium oxysporum f. sp. vasinfectum]|nr:Heterokaryon incompatibility [Fusarium oxysporum f. sp. vasinfectum]